ncbi:MAG: zinc-binding dehydrogenase [Candidatus Sumerlaeota bacterium]|nr:zinc-binding dehydrogenase [Candidatus Sumerlaeota bacterium]
MRAMQYHAPGRPEIVELPIPTPGENQVLVKVLGVTTCPQWDLHLMSGEPMFEGRPLPYPYQPGQPGHEAMGEVVAVGPGVAAPAVGRRVVAWRDQGHHRPGAYAQYNVFEAEHVLEIPRDIEPEDIASLELAMCLFGAFDPLARWTEIRRKSMAIGGLGPAGLIAVQMARAFGAADVIGIDPLPDRRALALDLGATEARDADPALLPKGAKAKDAFDLAIECAGQAASLRLLMNSTREAISIFGVLRGEVAYSQRHTRGLAILGYAGHSRAAGERALRLILDGQVRLRPLATKTLPLRRYAEGIQLLRERQAIKICYLPWAD